MEDRDEGKKSKCKKCGTTIANKYTYCSACMECNNEIAVIKKFPEDLEKTVSFFKLKLFEMFKKHNTIILSFTKSNMFIADIVIRDTNFFYLQEKRYVGKMEIIDSSSNQTKEIELIKAPLKLIPAVRALKEDSKRWYD